MSAFIGGQVCLLDKMVDIDRLILFYYYYKYKGDVDMANEKQLNPPKQWGLIILIAAMNMTVPLSIDMYLPAVPQMTDYFSTTASVVNLTLVGFFFFLAIGILIFGPLSDKYGRKPLLLLGTFLYLVFSGACALSADITQLILFRIFQALGAGCMVAVSTAIIKDNFKGKTRDVVLAVVQAMAVIAPMVAPLLGAFILTFATWRTTFWLLAVIAAVCLTATVFLQETLPEQQRYAGNLLGSMGRLFVVAKNKGFSAFLLIVALMSAPYMAYIAVSSYIYISFFQMSATTYSYYFAVNSAAAILGPLIYMRITGIVSAKKIALTCLITTLLSGFLVLFLGTMSSIIFLSSFILFTVAESAVRPFSTAILLDQQDKDVGSASSLINFVHTAFGSLGMVLGTLPWGNFIQGLGIILLVCGGIALIGWFLLLHSGTAVIGLNQQNR